MTESAVCPCDHYYFVSKYYRQDTHKNFFFLQAKTVPWIFRPYFAAENLTHLHANFYICDPCEVKIVTIIYLIVDRYLFLKTILFYKALCVLKL